MESVASTSEKSSIEVVATNNSATKENNTRSNNVINLIEKSKDAETNLSSFFCKRCDYIGINNLVFGSDIY